AFDPSESSRSPVTCLSSAAKRNTPADLLSAWLIKTLGSVAMPGYSHLLDEERDQIASLKAAGHSIGAIAKAVGRAKSTVSRELRRNALPSRVHASDLFIPN